MTASNLMKPARRALMALWAACMLAFAPARSSSRRGPAGGPSKLVLQAKAPAPPSEPNLTACLRLQILSHLPKLRLTLPPRRLRLLRATRGVGRSGDNSTGLQAVPSPSSRPSIPSPHISNKNSACQICQAHLQAVPQLIQPALDACPQPAKSCRFPRKKPAPQFAAPTCRRCPSSSSRPSMPRSCSLKDATCASAASRSAGSAVPSSSCLACGKEVKTHSIHVTGAIA